MNQQPLLNYIPQQQQVQVSPQQQQQFLLPSVQPGLHPDVTLQPQAQQTPLAATGHLLRQYQPCPSKEAPPTAPEPPSATQYRPPHPVLPQAASGGACVTFRYKSAFGPQFRPILQQPHVKEQLQTTAATTPGLGRRPLQVVLPPGVVDADWTPPAAPTTTTTAEIFGSNIGNNAHGFRGTDHHHQPDDQYCVVDDDDDDASTTLLSEARPTFYNDHPVKNVNVVEESGISMEHAGDPCNPVMMTLEAPGPDPVVVPMEPIVVVPYGWKRLISVVDNLVSYIR